MDHAYKQLVLFIFLLILTAFAVIVWRYLSKRRARSPQVESPIWIKNFPGASSKYVEIEGEKFHYIQSGQGTDLLLLHGIGASLFIWRYVFKQLARHYRVTAVDIPGFGYSSKKLPADYGLDAQRLRINRFLHKLHIHHCYLVGSSMGGALALWMAHEAPEKFPKVAALAPATSPEIIPKQFSKLIAQSSFTQSFLNRSTMKWILGHVVAKRELITPETIEAYLEPFLDDGTSVKTFFSAMQLLGDSRMPKCFKDIQSEVLLIQGRRDRLVTMKSIQRLAQVIESANVVISQSGGHHIMEDEPDWTTAELLHFFNEE